MATSKEYIEFVAEQIRGEYEIKYRKTFGEYVVYLNGKPVLLVCDDTVFVKKLPELAVLMKDAECGYPYPGAREHYILDIENAELTASVLNILERLTPLPKKKR